MPAFDTLLDESRRPPPWRVACNCPEARNAHDTQRLCEPNDAFDHAAQDDKITLTGAGRRCS